MSSPQRFARLALSAFDAMGHTTDTLVNQAGGPSSTYMTGLRKAAAGAPLKEPRSDTYTRIERAAGWVQGSARDVWRGAEPVLQATGLERINELLGLPVEDRPRGPIRRQYSSGPDGFAERLLDRLLDLEERLDAIEERLDESAPRRLEAVAEHDPVDPGVEAEETEREP